MPIMDYDVVVIGGGPAGLAAAQQVASRQVRVLLVDAAPALGGHFYKPLSAQFSGPLDSHHASLQELQTEIDGLARNQVDVWPNTSVWGIFRGAEATFGDGADAAAEPQDKFTLYVEDSEHAHPAVEASALIVAPGIYDRSLPFPGWTLPGVFTPGGVDFMIKTQGLLPGRRVIVAGTGPLQMAVAASLAEQGAEVVALLDTCAASDEWAHLPGAMWGQWSRMSEAGKFAATLLNHRVPMLFRHAVFRALGTPETGVAGAMVGRVDENGHPIRGTEKTFDVDAICIAYGFAPSVELTLHLGCAHDYIPRIGLYFPRHDAAMSSNVKGVFVAGDVTGAGGKTLAHLQGRVAGISALEMLGVLSKPAAAERRAKLEPAILQERRFGKMLWERFRVRPGLLDLVEDDTPICRCEGVTAAQIKASVADGAWNFRGAKLRTRVGMGACQGRYCFINAAMLLAHEQGCTVPEIGLLKIRPPLMPVQTHNLFSTR